MKTFKEQIQEAYGRRHDAYTRDYHSSVSGMHKHQSAAYHADGGANDEGWDREHHHKPADHPHSVHINGKKWKTFGSQSHATNVARKIQGATVHREETTCPACKQDPCQCDDSHGFVKEAEQIDELKLHFNADDANNTVNAKKMVAHLKKRGISASHQSGYSHRAVVNVDTKNSSDKAYVKNKVKDRYDVDVREEVEQIDELSTDLLARYKEKAGMAATAADKAKKYDIGHKRFKGIMKATFKQFANDAKK